MFVTHILLGLASIGSTNIPMTLTDQDLTVIFRNEVLRVAAAEGVHYCVEELFVDDIGVS